MFNFNPQLWREFEALLVNEKEWNQFENVGKTSHNQQEKAQEQEKIVKRQKSACKKCRERDAPVDRKDHCSG